jgi:hypothetical protein
VPGWLERALTVKVHVVTRSKDDTHFEKHEGRRTSSLERIRGLGATLHEVDWLHTKLYLNEKEAIIGSFNLTATGRDGPNLSVHLQGSDAALQALEQVDQWLPGFSDEVTAPSAPAPAATTGAAFCIRCERPQAAYNPSKPYCSDCWSKRRNEKHHKPETCCHRCGKHAESTLHQPVCNACASVSISRSPVAV